MKNCLSCARLAVLPLALAAAFPSAAQIASPAPQLGETVVTATRFAEPAESLPMGVSVITAEELRVSGATTVNDALMRLLGIVGRQDFYGGGDYALDLRGFGETAASNQVVIVDGVRLNEADLSGTRLAGIPIDTVERIEVLRGSGAVLYGEGATGGVIVITTKAGAGKERRNAASAQAGAGTHNLRELRANATLASAGFSLDASGLRRDSDNHRDNFRSKTDGASLTGQWSNDWLRLGTRYAEDSLDTGLPGSLTAAQYAANPRQTNTPNDHAQIENTRSGLFAEAQLGDWQLAADAGWRQKSLRSINSGFPFDFDVDANSHSLRARHDGRLAGAKNLLVLGTDYGQWTRNVLGAFGSVAHQSSRAWYVKDDVTLAASSTRLSAGWRTERIAKDNSSVAAGLSDRQHAWELGLSQPLAGGVTAYGRVGRSFRLANVDEFSFTAPSAILKPQTSRDLEFGARWSYESGKLDARLYRSQLNNEIGFDGALFANVNFDPTRRQGLELDATHALTRSLGLRLNAGLRESIFRSGAHAGRDVPLAPQRTLSVRADWTPAVAHRVTGGVNWVSSQHPDFDNACRIPAYTTADLRYAYQWRQVEWSLGVTNLFDKKYYTLAFGCSGGVTTAIYPEAGRAFTAAMRIRF